MNSRKWVGMFFKTLLIGGFAGLVTSFFVDSSTYSEVLNPVSLELIGVALFYIGLGLVFSIISQTGFFAYMFINRFGQGFFRSLWPTIQIFLIAFVTFDLIYFPYKGAEGNTPLYLFILMAAAVLVYGIVISLIKAKQTHQRAFIPALFVMVVMTSIEWVPGLQASANYAWLMIITLLSCNTYQLLILHHLTGTESDKDKQSRLKREKRQQKKLANSSKA